MESERGGRFWTLNHRILFKQSDECRRRPNLPAELGNFCGGVSGTVSRSETKRYNTWDETGVGFLDGMLHILQAIRLTLPTRSPYNSASVLLGLMHIPQAKRLAHPTVQYTPHNSFVDAGFIAQSTQEQWETKRGVLVGFPPLDSTALGWGWGIEEVQNNHHNHNTTGCVSCAPGIVKSAATIQGGQWFQWLGSKVWCSLRTPGKQCRYRFYGS